MSDAGANGLAVLERQPDLLDQALFPERPDVVEAIRVRPVVPTGQRYRRHTGRRFFKKLASCESLAEMVWTGLRLELSARQLAIRCGVSVNTLVAARRLMEERGEVDHIRRRIDRRLDEFVEEGFEYVLDGMRSGRIHPGQLPIPVLAGYDKRAQRDMGVVPGTELVAGEVMEANVRAAFAARQRVLAAIESQSIGSGSQAIDLHQQTSANPGLDTIEATASASPSAPDPASAVAVNQVQTISGPEGRGGGGGAAAAAAPVPSTPENF